MTRPWMVLDWSNWRGEIQGWVPIKPNMYTVYYIILINNKLETNKCHSPSTTNMHAHTHMWTRLNKMKFITHISDEEAIGLNPWNTFSVSWSFSTLTFSNKTLLESLFFTLTLINHQLWETDNNKANYEHLTVKVSNKLFQMTVISQLMSLNNSSHVKFQESNKHLIY